MANSVYTIITEKILEKLEHGVVPWHKPWDTDDAWAYNIVSHKEYALSNQILLAHGGAYGTFKQWQERGCQVRKGARSEIVTFCKPVLNAVVDKDGQEIIGPDGKPMVKKSAILRYYRVFHCSEVDGYEVEKPTSSATPEESFAPIESVDQVFMDYIQREGIRLEQELSARAYYAPHGDVLHLPLLSQFDDVHEYYATFAHELTHSTGHPDRLNRFELGHKFGSEPYAREELVAEIGAAAILNRLHVGTAATFDNSAAYIDSWSRALRADPKLFISASSKAEKAMNLILGKGETDG